MADRRRSLKIVVPAIAALFLQGCSVNVGVQEMAAIAKPANPLQRFEGTYQVSNGEISDIFWRLPYDAKTLRITCVSATQMTLAATRDDGSVETATVNAHADHGYLFLSLDRTSYSHALDRFHERSATGVGLDANGDLVWRADVREFVTSLLIIPMWFHEHKDGSARRISDAGLP